MASHPAKQVIIHDENLGIPHKKASFNDKSKNIKTAGKKGAALGNRKALNDITNKATVCQEVPLRKNNRSKEEVDGLEEGYLHDHGKCIESQRRILDRRFILDMLFPEDGNQVLAAAVRESTLEAKDDCVSSPLSCPESDEEPLELGSPPSSPLSGDTLPGSPFSWGFEPVEFVLKSEIDG